MRQVVKRPAFRRASALTVAVASALLAFTAPAMATTTASAGPATTNAGTPCGQASGAPSRIDHVIVLFMENQPSNDIIGSPQAPYINELAAKCGLATNYHNITHPSAPQYLAATSGELGGTGDCPPVPLEGWPAACPDTNDNIFHQLIAAGKTWKNYEESMPSNCAEVDDGSNYDINHNPAAYYTDLGGPSGTPGSPCQKFDVPMGTPQAGNFETDLAAGKLPNYSFIAPDLIHDTHNSTVAVGDEYLSQLIPTILDSESYRSGTTALFVTWDEGEGGSSDDCAFNTTDVGCHIPMVVVSPYTRAGSQSAKLFNHYSLLKTTEHMLQLPLLGHAKDPAIKSMEPAFNL